MRSLFLDLLFPSLSLDRSPGAWLTPQEQDALRAHPLLFDKRQLLRNGVQSIERLVASASYGSSPLLREAICRFKYRGMTPYVDALSRMMVQTSHFIPAWPAAVLTPVPLHWTRRFRRGFNQAAVLANAIARERDWPMMELLVRTRPTGSQAKRDHRERRAALANAFSFVGGPVPERVILVDDIVTTGATLEACAAALREAGVVRIEAVTLVVAFG